MKLHENKGAKRRSSL